MAIVSLRAGLATLSAAGVILVAIVTLTITLSSSLAALRDLGTNNARALMRKAESDAYLLFQRGTDPTAALVNLTQSLPWQPCSADDASYATFRSSSQMLFAAGIPHVTALHLYFKDNTVILWAQDSSSDATFSEMIVKPTNITANPVQTAVIGTREFFVENVTLDPSKTTPLWPAYLFTSSPMWGIVMNATDGGRTTTIVPPFAAGFALSGKAPPGGNASAPLNLVLGIITPLFVAGAPRTTANVFGVAGVYFDFSQLNVALSAARTTANSAVYAFDDDGFLLATSSATEPMATERRPVVSPNPPGCTASTDFLGAFLETSAPRMLCRRSIYDFPDARLNRFAQTQPTTVFATRRQVERVDVDGESVYVAAAPIPLAFPGLQPHLLLFMPEKDVIGNVYRSRNVAIGVTAAIVVAVAAVTVAVLWVLLSPLERLATRMQKAANLEDDETDAGLSAMTEVAALQTAYYAMNDELNRIRSFVPQSVLIARKHLGEHVAEDHHDEADDQDADLNASNMDLANASRGEDSKSDTKTTTRSASTRRGKSTNGAAATLEAMALLGSNPAMVRNVSVLSANTVGLHAAAAQPAATMDRVIAELSAVVTAMDEAVAKQQGVLTFHGDRFLATFNTARPVASHATRAVLAALAAVEAAAGSGVLKLRLACGVATGQCIVGTVGSARVKTLSTIGAAVTDAALMERLSRLYEGVSVLATQRACLEATSVCNTRFVDLVALPSKGKHRPTLVGLVTPLAASQNAAKRDAEWMYVMGSHATSACPFNKCFELLAGGDVHAAFTHYRSALEDESLGAGAPPPRLTAIMKKVEASVAQSMASVAVDPLDLCSWPRVTLAQEDRPQL